VPTSGSGFSKGLPTVSEQVAESATREQRGREALDELERLDDRQVQEVLGWLAASVPEHVLDACRGVRSRR
jgi:hypothetical protein